MSESEHVDIYTAGELEDETSNLSTKESRQEPRQEEVRSSWSLSSGNTEKNYSRTSTLQVGGGRTLLKK